MVFLLDLKKRVEDKKLHHVLVLYLMKSDVLCVPVVYSVEATVVRTWYGSCTETVPVGSVATGTTGTKICL